MKRHGEGQGESARSPGRSATRVRRRIRRMMFVGKAASLPNAHLPPITTFASSSSPRTMLTHHRPPSVLSTDDPLSLAMRPPASETDAQRQARLLEEANAQRLSDLIDEQIKQDKKKFDKAKEDVKVGATRLVFFVFLTGSPSSYSSVKPSLGNRHSRNNSNSCTAQKHSRRNVPPGEPSFISMSLALSSGYSRPSTCTAI